MKINMSDISAKSEAEKKYYKVVIGKKRDREVAVSFDEMIAEANRERARIESLDIHRSMRYGSRLGRIDGKEFPIKVF